MAKTVLQKQLEQRMREKGFNMKSLSQAAGKNDTYIRDILEGRVKNPSYSSMQAIAEKLDCEVADLIQEGNFAERSTVKFRGYSGVPKNKNFNADIIVNATLLIKEVANKKKIKLSKDKISELALKTCEMAMIAGSQVITQNLVEYILEVHKSQK